jgi:hypothetical protein
MIKRISTSNSIGEPDMSLKSKVKTSGLLAGLLTVPFLLAPALTNASVPATAKVNTTKLKVDDKFVYVGQLHSATGTMAISETGSIQAERLAIEQINKKGGVLGRQIKIIQEDGASDWPTFAEKARKLSEKDRVAAIFGCWTSASRKAVLPIIERNNSLLYYPTFYEGLEQSKNVIYTGQEATQQVLEALNWLAKEKKAKTFYLIGSDYIWPRTTMKIARTHIEKVLKGKVVGEEYYPLGHTQFGSLINKTKLRKPDAIFAAVVSSIGGAMFTLQVGFMSPTIIGIVPSIEMVILAAVGGRLSLIGAVYGAVLVNLGKTYFSEAFPEVWLYFLGALFIGVVMFLPNGLAGLYEKYVRPLFLKKKPIDSTSPPPSSDPDKTIDPIVEGDVK